MRGQSKWVVGIAIVALTSGLARAQAPAGSAPPREQTEDKGITLNSVLGGSASSGSRIYDWTTSVGYQFNEHLSVNAGLPVLFFRGTTATGKSTSSNGLGDVFGQGQMVFRNPLLNYGTILTVALPTGDSSKGLSTGRVTFDWTNQVARQFGRFTPFLSAGLGNSLMYSSYWNRPYYTLGDTAHFEAGTTFSLARRIMLGASAYDVAPWGTQKVYSRVVTPNGGGNGGTASHGRVFQQNPLTTGGAELDRDNGFNADVDFRPAKYVNFVVAYTHSVHFQLDTVSFSVGFNLTPLLRERGIFGN